MHIDLTEEQEEAIALNWIERQQQRQNGYKKVLDALLTGAHFAAWSWLDALRYGVKKCSRTYCVDRRLVLDDLCAYDNPKPTEESA